jgi:hypothetical protein
MKISTFTLKGIDIDLTFNKGVLAYIFTFDGKQYGNAIKPKSRSVLDVSSTTFLLLTNALESIEALKQ